MTVLGCSWYPEHWPEARWPEDLRLMQQTGMTVVRMAEFAWSRLEPSEGNFQLDWLQRAVDLAADYGLKVVLGTPTAGPPIWLTQLHPEVLRVDEHGRRDTHGIRCHYSPASPVYIQYCVRIVETMARQFGHHPNVIGWQIDNELGWGGYSYDQELHRQFQHWLKAKFGTLPNLNERWSTVYWSQEYTDWSQIPLPIGNHNPGLKLAFKQFMTHVFSTFQNAQVDVIRKLATPVQWITHNYMKWNEGFDHYLAAESLDLVSWNNYVPTGHLDYVENGAMHDLARGYKQRHFWVMETQPGQVNWGNVNTSLNRGEVRAMAWHAIAHGADAILYWQWRSAPGGQEQMHGTLIAPDGTPRPVYDEVSQLGKDLEKARPYLIGRKFEPEIALLHSFDDRWAIDIQRHHSDFDPVKQLLHYYRPLRETGHMLDLVSTNAELVPYKLVIAPTLHILSDDTARRLSDYVMSGGHLVLGPRSGVKDAYNALLPLRQPGLLAELLGGYIEEYYALAQPISVSGEIGTGSASIWAEQICVCASNVEILATFASYNGWLDDKPAVITRQVGQGRITYLAACLDANLMRSVVSKLLKTSAIQQQPEPLLPGIERSVYNLKGKEFIILINYLTTPQDYVLDSPKTDVLTDHYYQSRVSIKPYGVVVLY